MSKKSHHFRNHLCRIHKQQIAHDVHELENSKTRITNIGGIEISEIPGHATSIKVCDFETKNQEVVPDRPDENEEVYSAMECFRCAGGSESLDETEIAAHLSEDTPFCESFKAL